MSSPEKEAPSYYETIWGETCPICLGPIINRSFPESCTHQFCFECLEVAASYKNTCPICKRPFSKIVYNVTSNRDFDIKEVTIATERDQELLVEMVMRPLQDIFQIWNTIRYSFPEMSRFRPLNREWEHFRVNVSGTPNVQNVDVITTSVQRLTEVIQQINDQMHRDRREASPSTSRGESGSNDQTHCNRREASPSTSRGESSSESPREQNPNFPPSQFLDEDPD